MKDVNLPKRFLLFNQKNAFHNNTGDNEHLQDITNFTDGEWKTII